MGLSIEVKGIDLWLEIDVVKVLLLAGSAGELFLEWVSVEEGSIDVILLDWGALQGVSIRFSIEIKVEGDLATFLAFKPKHAGCGAAHVRLFADHIERWQLFGTDFP